MFNKLFIAEIHAIIARVIYKPVSEQLIGSLHTELPLDLFIPLLSPLLFEPVNYEVEGYQSDKDSRHYGIEGPQRQLTLAVQEWRYALILSQAATRVPTLLVVRAESVQWPIRRKLAFSFFEFIVNALFIAAAKIQRVFTIEIVVASRRLLVKNFEG